MYLPWEGGRSGRYQPPPPHVHHCRAQLDSFRLSLPYRNIIKRNKMVSEFLADSLYKNLVKPSFISSFHKWRNGGFEKPGQASPSASLVAPFSVLLHLEAWPQLLMAHPRPHRFGINPKWGRQHHNNTAPQFSPTSQNSPKRQNQ